MHGLPLQPLAECVGLAHLVICALPVEGPDVGSRLRLSSPRPLLPQYARQEMARRTVGPRRSDSLRTYVRSTRIIGGLSVLVLCGAVVWDLVDDRLWVRH